MQSIALAGAQPNNPAFDNGPAISAALAASPAALVPPGVWAVRTPVVMPPGTRLVGERSVSILHMTETGAAMEQRGMLEPGDGCVIASLTLDGGNSLSPKSRFNSYCVKLAAAEVRVEDCVFQNTRRAAVQATAMAQQCAVVRSLFNRGVAASTTILVEGAYGLLIDACDLTGNPSNFGVYLVDGAEHCTISRCTVFNTPQLNAGVRSLEMVGITRTCRQITVRDCTIEGTGDNGISVTGSRCMIVNNRVTGCWHSGICVYGSQNAVFQNLCIGNGRRFEADGTSWGNFTINPAFGGEGRGNTLMGNIAMEGPASHGLRLLKASYGLWEAGKVWPASNPYCRSQGSVYLLTSGSTTGTTPPTHTSGAVSDGACVWHYLFPLPEAAHSPSMNNVWDEMRASQHRISNAPFMA
jgi:parallel beta-helix repeat protein